jgi:actin-like ATPase involved in cell morphogenesis
MSYALGVDLGTTYTAAAVARDGRVDVADLGERAPAFPSVLFLLESGGFLAGEAAQRRGADDPGRMAREFKRRLGDDTALLVGGTPFSAQALLGQLLRHVLGSVAQGQGGLPDQVILTYPANWGPYRRELMGQVVSAAGLDTAEMRTEPEAAAIHFASTERVGLGDVIATYDLGGGTFDAAVLRKSVDGFDLLGQAGGIEHLGGVDFDAAIFDHVIRSLGSAVQDLDPDEQSTRTGLERLRRDCVEAKEGLSADTEVSIAVHLPSVQTTVRLSRNEFEDLVRPNVIQTIASFEQTLRSAGVPVKELSATVLVGGSARVPLVAETLTSQLGVPVSLSPAPKHCVAIGAAQSALAQAPPAVPPPPPPPPPQLQDVHATVAVPVTNLPAPPAHELAPAALVPTPEPARPEPVSARSAPVGRGRGDYSMAVLAVGAVLLVAALVLAFSGPSAEHVTADQAASAQGLRISGAPAEAGKTLDVNLGEPLVITGPQRITDSTLAFTIAGLSFPAKQGTPQGRGSVIDVHNSTQLLVAGPLKATLTVNGGEHELPLNPEQSWWLTVPGIAWIVLLMFAVSYAESVQRNVRRRRRASFVTIFGMNVVGLLLGVSVVLAAWTAGGRLLVPWVVVVVLLCCAGAGGCLPLMLRERTGAARRT